MIPSGTTASLDRAWIIPGENSVAPGLPLGALALGSNPRKSAKDGVGERDVPVAFGGVEFVPGQTLWADEDGIVATRL